MRCLLPLRIARWAQEIRKREMSGDREARSSHQNSQIELAKASGSAITSISTIFPPVIVKPRLGLAPLGGLLGALLQLGHGEVLLVRGEVPDVAEGIAQRPGAVAVELVLHGLHDRAAR